MPREALSVTLDAQNITWLKGRVGAGGGRSVSELLDRIVTDARTSGRLGLSRSVVGTIEIDPSDPTLHAADAAVRALFDESLGRPLLVHEPPAAGRGRARGSKRRG